MTKQYHRVLTDINAAEKENHNGFIYLCPIKELRSNISERLSHLSKEQIKAIETYMKNTDFKYEAWSILTLDLSPDLSVAFALVPENPEMFKLLQISRKLIQALSERKRRNIIAPFAKHQSKHQTQIVDALTSALTVHNFQNPQFGKKLKEKKHQDVHLTFVVSKQELDSVSKVAKSAERSARATNLVRELTVMPANILDCANYVKHAKDLAKKAGLDSEFTDLKKLRSLGAGAFVAVAQASRNNDAGILKISYKAKEKKSKRICLVGKGIMFDTGGVNVKTGTSMFGMHGDMMGSAICLALVLLAAEEKWPVSIDSYLAIAENSISEIAFRPNEVVIASNGLSIETVHTDAEGRMVLSDTLYMASKSKPDAVIDFATLTGSAVRAIGTNYSAAFSNQADWYQLLIDAGKSSGERIWPFPMDADYGDCLDSEIADTKQCRLSGGADHIEAAMFLGKFIEHQTPWVHIDLSASENDGGLAHVSSKETGFGIRVAKEIIEKIVKV